MTPPPELELGSCLVLEASPHPDRPNRTLGKLAVTLSEPIDGRVVSHGVTVSVVIVTRPGMTEQEVQQALIARARQIVLRAVS